MRKMYLTSLIIVTILLISSCNQKKPDNSIRFWHSFVVATHPVLDSLINQFEKQNPGVQVIAQYIPTGDALIQKLISAIQSHTTPDIAWVHPDFFNRLVESRAIFSMPELFRKYNYHDVSVLDDIYPELLRPVTYDDTLYAIPMEASTLALVYNKNLLKNAGLNPDHPPADWDELMEYTRKLTIDRDNDGRTDIFGFYVPVFPASGPLNIWMVLQWTPFLWQAGGHIMNEGNTGVVYNDHAGIAALTLWSNLYREMQFEKFTVAHDLGFISQKVAMILDGPWNLPKYRKITSFAWGIAPLPKGPETQKTYLSAEYLVVFRESRNPKHAFEFINWMIRPDIQAEFSIKSGYLPVRKSVFNLPEYQTYLAQDEALNNFCAQMSIARARFPVKNYSLEINKHIAEAIENSIIGNMEPVTALNQSALKSNKLIRNVDKSR